MSSFDRKLAKLTDLRPKLGFVDWTNAVCETLWVLMFLCFVLHSTSPSTRAELHAGQAERREIERQERKREERERDAERDREPAHELSYSESDAGEKETFLRGGHGDLRNTRSARPVTSLSDSKRPTRSMKGVESLSDSIRPTCSKEEVELKGPCPSKQRADALLRFSQHTSCSLPVVKI